MKKQLLAGMLALILALPLPVEVAADGIDEQEDTNIIEIEEQEGYDFSGIEAQEGDDVPEIEEQEQETTLDIEEIILDQEDSCDNTELLEGYIQKQFYGSSDISLFGSYYGDRLTGSSRRMYEYLREKSLLVASGEVSFTQFVCDSQDILSTTKITAEEAGVEAVSAENAKEIAATMIDYNSASVIRALVSDIPYELFWFDKQNGGLKIAYKLAYTNSYVRIKTFTFSMTVSNDYRSTDSLTVNADRFVDILNAADLAHQIIEEAKELSDLDKLYYYRQRICNLASYNYEATSSSYSGGYGDPWQLIFVFDGDPETNVVCEGYSKAFQYLVDETDFSSDDIYSLMVTGSVQSGLHMWNVLHMDDGRNYLVDLTFSDQLSKGDVIQRFIVAPDEGSVEDGYTFYTKKIESDTGTFSLIGSKYIYDLQTRSYVAEEDLTLAESGYGEPEPVFGIIQQPVNVEAMLQSTVNFTLRAKKAVSYQWYYSKDQISWFKSSAEGNSTNTLTLTLSKTNSKNFYRCVVTGIQGEEEKSDIVWAQQPLVSITKQPQDVQALVGDTVSFSVAAENTLFYQWYYSKDGTKWYKSTISGNDTNTLELTVTSGNKENFYRCRMKGITGDIVYTNPVTIQKPFLRIITQPSDVTATLGETISFHVDAENTIQGGYQWYYSKDGVRWYKSTGEGAATDTITLKVSSSNSCNLYRCRLTGRDGTILNTDSAGIHLRQ